MKYILFLILFVLGIFSIIIIVFTPDIYLLKIIQSFSIQIVISILIFSIILLLLKKYIYSLSIFVLFIILFLYLYVVTVQPFDKYISNSNNNDVSFKIAHFNLLASNKDFESTINSITKIDPDIISFQELTKDWDDIFINDLNINYPFSIKETNDGVFGIAIYSKYLLFDATIKYINNIPYIKGKININNNIINILCAHTMPPINENAYKLRNKQLSILAKEITNNNYPSFYIGDFNIVPWSNEMILFKKETNTFDSRCFFQATYPSYNLLLGVPIDYILYPKEYHCIKFKLIKKTSSDHYGIYGEYFRK